MAFVCTPSREHFICDPHAFWRLLTSCSASKYHSGIVESHLHIDCTQEACHHTVRRYCKSGAQNMQDENVSTFVLRWPQGIHACETRCRALVSRGIWSRNNKCGHWLECGEMIADMHAPPGMGAVCVKGSLKIRGASTRLCCVVHSDYLFCFERASFPYPVHSRPITDLPPLPFFFKCQLSTLVLSRLNYPTKKVELTHLAILLLHNGHGTSSGNRWPAHQ